MPISKSDLKKFSALNRKSKREETNSFIVEGRKSCLELLKSNFKIISILITDEKLNYEFPNPILISEKEATRLSQLKSKSDVIAIVEIPKINLSNIINNDTVLYLDSVNDPGNLGTIIRTLDWFGYTNLFCSNKSVDVYNNKVVMASMGSIFRVNVHYLDFKELIEKLPNHLIYGSFLEGENIYEKKINEKAIIVMGNESNGISKEIEKKVINKIMIPGKGGAESLNLSTAAAIILNEINRGKFN